ncbi:MAG: hypothetical protein A2Y03_00895 [Omnitrophica WOR_2 bacterium GWF2_38_59]|nr:MAG: hypothetical protein A2Y06_03475 [Omnitrophica WOR_2 bacterium GWA2_37_7]OGX24000.1 MAG: hypothetical protein A2Y03_00895 [Omnitrophica WOR_2 bacterium GWF2_38_59]OGX46912.1 MAG: hypothetical protein A2243_12015 [Omnitrophica WOR_2 bacterium RIFOXYA2_FULL_38_17]OGX52479.1 MAG: hypothetical protein A2267_05315 [Omnitrophica WOR_2 bacterium RIFOXYA12_FULL_38_10]OGX56492.1 MAG: hypothetical protein A2447_10200 [Omnitrophica WOR_2 bacterium RIFOXYC2_FULL_38_12]OGX58380.1 MAG: hypothetical 
MKKEIICIECPNGCVLSLEIKDGEIVNLEGNKCDKGKVYAVSEIENPVRVLTTTVMSEGLSVLMVPVKTREPIPKSELLNAMEKIRKIKVKRSVEAGEVIVRNFMGLGVDLVATRSVS